jgi:hypothetical protein
MELICPSESLPDSASTRMGWMLPSSPRPSGWSPGSSRNRASEAPRSVPELLSWACALLQSPPSLEWPPRRRRSGDQRGSSHEVPFPFSVSPLGAAASWPGLPHPTACASRFSQPPGASIRPEPAGLVSCRIRSWGCTLQSFAPAPQPYAVSDAAPLVTLGGELCPSEGQTATAEAAAALVQVEGRDRVPAFRVSHRGAIRHSSPVVWTGWSA